MFENVRLNGWIAAPWSLRQAMKRCNLASSRGLVTGFRVDHSLGKVTGLKPLMLSVALQMDAGIPPLLRSIKLH